MFRDDTGENAWRSILIVEPSDVLSQDCLEKLHAKLESQIVSTPAEAQYLTESAQSDGNHKSCEGPSPLVALVLIIFYFFVRSHRQSQNGDISREDKAKHR